MSATVHLLSVRRYLSRLHIHPNSGDGLAVLAQPHSPLLGSSWLHYQAHPQSPSHLPRGSRGMPRSQTQTDSGTSGRTHMWLTGLWACPGSRHRPKQEGGAGETVKQGWEAGGHHSGPAHCPVYGNRQLVPSGTWGLMVRAGQGSAQYCRKLLTTPNHLLLPLATLVTSVLLCPAT